MRLSKSSKREGNPNVPLLWNNLTVHNAAELEPVPEAGPDAARPVRLPTTLLPSLNPGARAKAFETAGVELRWVADGPITLTLSAPDAAETAQRDALLFHGRYQHWTGAGNPGLRHTLRHQPTELRIDPPESHLIENDEDCRQRSDFDPAVYRLLLPTHAGPVTLHGLRPDPGVTVRPPTAEQLPPKRILFYGTSITQGAGASASQLTYPALTATRLDADALNLGLGGSCHCEPELIDHIAADVAWDAACLALSVNMVGKFDDDEFAKRVRYAVHTCANTHPDKPVVAITLWPYRGDLPNHPHHDKAQRFRQHLRDAVATCPTANAHLLEGPELFPRFDRLSTDLIHPGDLAFIEMSHLLAEKLAPLLTPPASPTTDRHG